MPYVPHDYALTSAELAILRGIRVSGQQAVYSLCEARKLHPRNIELQNGEEHVSQMMASLDTLLRLSAGPGQTRLAQECRLWPLPTTPAVEVQDV